MNIEQLLDICQSCGRRPVMISSGNAAVIAVAGMEGRLFYVHDGQLVSLSAPKPQKISAMPKPDISTPAATASGPPRKVQNSVMNTPPAPGVCLPP